MAKAKKTETENVRIAPDMFGEANPVLAEVMRAAAGCESPRVMMVADANVVQRVKGLGLRIGAWMRAFGFELACPPVILGGGEKVKCDTLQSALSVVSAAIEAKVGRTDVLLALGGGSVLDVAGWAAAQIRGSIPLVRVPTTVAAMVDAAFAEKASLDGFAIKDALSVPSRAAGVVVDPRFADTVLDGVWRGGFGEIMRLALVSGAALTKKLAANVDAIRARDTEMTDALIAAAVELRLKKGGTPFALWSALRFQTLSGFKLPHGYAVPMGICLDCAYAAEKGYLPRETCSWVRGTLEACGALDGLAHSQHLLAQPERLLAGLDAWRLATGSTALVLPSGIGSSCEEAVPDRDVYQTAIASQLTIPKGT